MRQWLVCVTLPLLGCVAVALAEEAPAVEPAKVSRPFEYSGYSKPQYMTSRRFGEYVTMSDGVKLAIDVYLPTGGAQGKRFPVVMQYTPYHRSTIDPKTGQVVSLMPPVFNQFLLSYGYAVVYADMRGTGASTGWMHDFMPRIAQDGGELVDWIAKQAWCDGNIGMFGGSYMGWSQIAIAGQGRPALKCIIPAVVPLDGYTGEVRPGGIYCQGMVNRWSTGMYYRVRNYYDPAKNRMPATPVVDEDGDGKLTDEIPLDANGDGGFLDDGFPPKYSDDAARKHIYFLATQDHLKDYDYAAVAVKGTFIDTPSPLGFTAYDLGPSAHVPGVMASKVAVCNVGGWFDGFTRGTFELFCTMRGTNPSRIIIAPAYHDILGGPFWKYLGDDPLILKGRFLLELVRIFDRWLKGIPNGVDTEPPVCIYVMHGGGWRLENEWPLKRQVVTKFFLGAENRLSRETSGDGADSYKADFTHDSSYGQKAGNRMLSLAGGTPDALPIRTEKDRQCLCYTSAPVEENTEVTGHPMVRLHVSSTAAYGDFFVYLEDVDDQGQAILVCEGLLRAEFAGLRDNNRIIRRGVKKIEVLPKLPWHGYEKADYADSILAGGKTVELVFDLQPTAWVFRKGHRIRVAIACADYPTFELHPKLSPTNKPDAADNIVPTVTVHRADGHRSLIELPVIPKG